MKHLATSSQLTPELIEKLCNMADDIRLHPQRYSHALDGKVVATMFFEPSTRTRLSFEAAILRLGASNISTENAAESSSWKKSESLQDTIRMLHSYADCIVIRHPSPTSAEDAIAVAKVPFINGGSGKAEHPTQALLDMYTIKRAKGRLDNLKVAILGDLKYGRTSHSLAKLLSLYPNQTVYTLSDDSLAFPQEYIDYMTSHGVKYIHANSFDDLPKDLDIFYNTRVQKERFEGNDASGDDNFKRFIINKEVMSKFSDETYILHPLPRNEEIDTDIDDDPRSLPFEQAKNGMYIRMALLLEVMNA